MLTIQEVGKEILTNNPRSFYVMLGPEYGVKSRYIETLKDYYGSLIEVDDVSSVLRLMTTKRLIPLQPSLYVVRYDQDFLSGLNDKSESEIRNCKICGTIVCIYEDIKGQAKLEKYLSNYCVHVDKVTDQFEFKYLKTEFPELADRWVQIAMKASANYGHARLICRILQRSNLDKLSGLSDDEIISLFGYNDISTDFQLKSGVAARNFVYLMNWLDNYNGTVDAVLYNVLSTMVELDKIQKSKYSQSNLKEYAKLWSAPDIYYMFMHTFELIRQLRSSAYIDSKEVLIGLFALLSYTHVPNLEVLNEF